MVDFGQGLLSIQLGKGHLQRKDMKMYNGQGSILGPFLYAIYVPHVDNEKLKLTHNTMHGIASEQRSLV